MSPQWLKMSPEQQPPRKLPGVQKHRVVFQKYQILNSKRYFLLSQNEYKWTCNVDFTGITQRTLSHTDLWRVKEVQQNRDVVNAADSPVLSSVTEVSSSNMWQWPVSINLSSNHISGDEGYYIPSHSCHSLWFQQDGCVLALVNGPWVICT